MKSTHNRNLAAAAAATIPAASYWLAHWEVRETPALWALLAASLAYSAPTLAKWAESWCKDVRKAWAFAILLEGIMTFSYNLWLSSWCLVLLALINAVSAYESADVVVEKEKVKRARVRGKDLALAS